MVVPPLPPTQVFKAALHTAPGPRPGADSDLSSLEPHVLGAEELDVVPDADDWKPQERPLRLACRIERAKAGLHQGGTACKGVEGPPGEHNGDRIACAALSVDVCPPKEAIYEDPIEVVHAVRRRLSARCGEESRHPIPNTPPSR